MVSSKNKRTMMNLIWRRMKKRTTAKEKKTKKKVKWSVAKIKGLWWTSSGAEWKNAAHLVDRTANWCIGGCWFTLAPETGIMQLTVSFMTRHSLRIRRLGLTLYSWSVSVNNKFSQFCTVPAVASVPRQNQSDFALSGDTFVHHH